MKLWMKILMWAGLGGGIGFFAGFQVGQRSERKNREREQQEYDEERELEDRMERSREDLHEYMDQYLGKADTDEEEPEMPMEEPEIPDYTGEKDADTIQAVPRIHPTMLAPEIVTEEEYYENRWGYEEERLIFYQMDEVLYNVTTQSIIENPDNVIGVGTLFEFGGDPKHPLDKLFVINEIFGTRFRIDLLDEAFCDAVEGNTAPETEEDEEKEDDFWGDV